jgi:hypothetical protein
VCSPKLNDTQEAFAAGENYQQRHWISHCRGALLGLGTVLILPPARRAALIVALDQINYLVCGLRQCLGCRWSGSSTMYKPNRHQLSGAFTFPFFFEGLFVRKFVNIL